MKTDTRTRLHYRIQSGMFVILFVGFLGVSAWLSQHYSISFDLSSNQRNSLSPETAGRPAHINRRRNSSNQRRK